MKLRITYTDGRREIKEVKSFSCALIVGDDNDFFDGISLFLTNKDGSFEQLDNEVLEFYSEFYSEE